MICQVEGASFSYPGSSGNALSEVSLTVPTGAHVALVGPNGAGKSTLLKLLTGILRPQQGVVTILGRSSTDWPRRELARELAVVSQAGDLNVPVSVRDLVAMGRHPYLNPWAPLSSADRDVVEECLEAVDLSDLAGRRASDLSGGELQRARLARALAQEPRLLLLDEPTAHLDLGHEARFMDLLSHRKTSKGLTVVAVTHHLNTAALYADEMVLMAAGRVVKKGRGNEVLVPHLLETAFGWPVEVADLGNSGRQAVPWVAPRRSPAGGGGSGPRG
jgi:iron complex transport system ATP-binding protein